MKQWKEPMVEELDISATAKHVNQGNGSTKQCIFDPTDRCNAMGNGKGICKNCSNNPANVTSTLS